MEVFAQIPAITQGILKKANLARLNLRVVTIADLADPTGRFIPDGMLTGSWQAGSDLKWPDIPVPPKPCWAAFWRCLRRSFCYFDNSAPSHTGGLTLDIPLGQWLSVPRNTWFPVYRSVDSLYYRSGDDIYLFQRSAVSGFYHSEGSTSLIPLDAHPISYKQIGEIIWTQR